MKKCKKGTGKYRCGQKFDHRMDFFKALSCSKRIKILELIKNESLNVTELSEKLNLDKSVTSRHLAILHHAKIITYSKEGLNVYYYVTNDLIYEILDKVKRNEG